MREIQQWIFIVCFCLCTLTIRGGNGDQRKFAHRQSHHCKIKGQIKVFDFAKEIVTGDENGNLIWNEHDGKKWKSRYNKLARRTISNCTASNKPDALLRFLNEGLLIVSWNVNVLHRSIPTSRQATEGPRIRGVLRRRAGQGGHLPWGGGARH